MVMIMMTVVMVVSMLLLLVLMVVVVMVVMQVAKALLEDKGASGVPPTPGPATAAAAVTPSTPTPASTSALLSLLHFRERSLVASVAGAMAAAQAAAAPRGPKAAAAAAAAAFEDNLDRVLAIGWANVERFCLANLVDKAAAAPSPDVAAALAVMALLYGLTRVEKDAAFFLSSGALGRQDGQALRSRVNALCAALSANSGKQLLQLCDGFGMPDHALWYAPVAFDWRKA